MWLELLAVALHHSESDECLKLKASMSESLVSYLIDLMVDKTLLSNRSQEHEDILSVVYLLIGKEHGVGVFVSLVSRGSQADVVGLKVLVFNLFTPDSAKSKGDKFSKIASLVKKLKKQTAPQ